MDCLTSNISTNRHQNEREMSEFHLNRRLHTSLSAPSESPLLHFRSSFDDEASNDFNGCFLYARNNDDVIKEFRNVFLEKYLEKNRVGRKTKSKLKQSNSNSLTLDKCSKVLQFDTLDSDIGSKNADSSSIDIGNEKRINCEAANSTNRCEIESFEETACRFKHDPFLNGGASNEKAHYPYFSPVQIISHQNDLGRFQASSNYSSSSNDSSLSSVASSYLCSCSFMESSKQATSSDFKPESLTLNGLKIQEEVELFDQSANHSTDYSQTTSSIWDHSNIYRMDNEITRMLFNFELDTCGNLQFLFCVSFFLSFIFTCFEMNLFFC